MKKINIGVQQKKIEFNIAGETVEAVVNMEKVAQLESFASKADEVKNGIAETNSIAEAKPLLEYMIDNSVAVMVGKEKADELKEVFGLLTLSMEIAPQMVVAYMEEFKNEFGGKAPGGGKVDVNSLLKKLNN